MKRVGRWTGRQATALREALRMTQEAYAADLQVGATTVQKWARQPEMVLSGKLQEVLDCKLGMIDEAVREIFWTLVADLPSPTHSPAAAETAEIRSSPGELLVISAEYPRRLDESVARVGQLMHHDLIESPQLGALEVRPDTWSDIVDQAVLEPEFAFDVPAGDSFGLTAGDVEAVRQATEMFSGHDYRFGGGRARLSVVQYLSTDVHPRIALAKPGSKLGSEYLSETAALLRLAGWTAYDVGYHGLAHRYFIHGLRLARAAGDVMLAGRILAAMSHQANFLGHYQRAADLARTAIRWGHRRATATSMALYHAMEARALASQRDEPACLKAIREAENWFARSDPALDPDWLHYFDAAELAAEIAHCFRDLGRAELALEYAELSVRTSKTFYVRSLSFCRTVLATSHLQRGELEGALDVARAVVSTALVLRSTRVVTYLDDFRRRLMPFADTAAVQDFNEYARTLERDPATRRLTLA